MRSFVNPSSRASLHFVWQLLMLCTVLLPTRVEGCDASVQEVGTLEVKADTNLPCNLTGGTVHIDIGVYGIENIDTSGVRYLRILKISGAGTCCARKVAHPLSLPPFCIMYLPVCVRVCYSHTWVGSITAFINFLTTT